MKKIILLECPTNLGLIKTEDRDEPGVKRLPDWMRSHHFHTLLNPDYIYRLEGFPFEMHLDPFTQVRNAENIIKYAEQQTSIMEQQLHKDSFVIVLGGDCSILIGSALALKKKGTFGLFFLDGHTDYTLPELSQTHGAAGMDLAIVCGYGHRNLTDIQHAIPYLKEEHVYCVGNREYDDDYERPIIESNVTYYPLYKLRKEGATNVVGNFLSMVDQEQLDGFFIHLDVDVLNDTIMPAVDCRQEDGLTYEELLKIVTTLVQSNQCFGIEITILDPDLDPKGRYTRDFIKNIIRCFKHIN